MFYLIFLTSGHSAWKRDANVSRCFACASHAEFSLHAFVEMRGYWIFILLASIGASADLIRPSK
jgi:hypothetical protein